MVGSGAPTTLRPIPLGKAIALSIVTLSVYFWILVWRNSSDIQGARTDGFSWWKVMFVLGFFTGVTMIVVYALNFVQIGKIRAQTGADNTLGIVALVLLVVPFAAPIVWGIHSNETAQATGAAPMPAHAPISA